jgi:hypothetical protein
MFWKLRAKSRALAPGITKQADFKNIPTTFLEKTTTMAIKAANC